MKDKWIMMLITLVFLAAAIGGIVKFLRTDNRPKVVVVLPGLDIEYWNVIKAGAENGFREFDIDGKVVAPGDKSKKDVQEYVLKNILKENPDVLVVSSVQSPAIMSILKKFVEHKIPVLLVDADMPLEHKTAYIGTDNFELGKKAGELLASELQPGDEVAFPFLTEDLTRPIFSERLKGATFSLEAAGIKIVTESSNESSSIRKAMTTILQKHPDVKGVYTLTDIDALDALAIIEERGFKMPIVGADGTTKMVESIEEGMLTGTVAQNPYDMGYISVETASKVIKGERVRKNIDTGVDLITKEDTKQRLGLLKEWLK